MTLFIASIGVAITLVAIAGVVGSTLFDQRAQRKRTEDSAINHQLAVEAAEHGLESAHLRLLNRSPWRGQKVKLDQRISSAKAKQAHHHERASNIAIKIEQKKLAIPTAFIAVLSLFWAIATIMIWRLDIDLIVTLGYPSGTAIVLGSLATIAIETFGLIFWTTMGFHVAIQAFEHHRIVRILAAGLAVTAAFTLTATIVNLADVRSEAQFGPQIRDLEAVIEVLGERGESSELAVASINLAEVRSTQARARQLDRSLAVLAPFIVFVLSWAPIHGIEHAAMVTHQLRSRRAGRRRDKGSSRLVALSSAVREELEQRLAAVEAALPSRNQAASRHAPETIRRNRTDW